MLDIAVVFGVALFRKRILRLKRSIFTVDTDCQIDGDQYGECHDAQIEQQKPARQRTELRRNGRVADAADKIQVCIGRARPCADRIRLLHDHLAAFCGPAQHSFDHGIRLFLFQQRHAACVGLSVCIHDQKLTLRAVCHTVAELHQPLGADIRNKEAIIAIERGSDRQNITENGFVGGRAAVAKLAHCRLLRHTGHSCKIPNERCVEKVIQCTK